MARPSKFDQAFVSKIIELAKQGKTNEQIAEIIGIAPSTLHYWKVHNKEFSIALNEAKQFADEIVEASLFRKAVGYSHKAVKIMAHEGHSWEHEYVEHYPPDSTAAIFWLKNRQPENWRDKQEVEHSGSVAIKRFKLGHKDDDRTTDRTGASETDGTTEESK